MRSISELLQDKTFIVMWVSLAFILILSFSFLLESFNSFRLNGRVVRLETRGDCERSPSVLKSKSSNQAFPDEMYDNFRYVISALTAKIKHGTSLNPQELSQFRNCIDAIIEEAIRDQNLRSTEVDELNLTGNESLSSLPGFSNSWMLPQIENSNERSRKESGDLQADEYHKFIRGLSAS